MGKVGISHLNLKKMTENETVDACANPVALHITCFIAYLGYVASFPPWIPVYHHMPSCACFPVCTIPHTFLSEAWILAIGTLFNILPLFQGSLL